MVDLYFVMPKHKLLQDLIEYRLQSDKVVKVSINTSVLPPRSPYRSKFRRLTIVDRGPQYPIRILTDGLEVDEDLTKLIHSYTNKSQVYYEQEHQNSGSES